MYSWGKLLESIVYPYFPFNLKFMKMYIYGGILAFDCRRRGAGALKWGDQGRRGHGAARAAWGAAKSYIQEIDFRAILIDFDI